MIATLTRNELRRLFLQPLAWVLLAAVLAVLAYYFLLALQGFLMLMPKIAGLADAPGVTDLVALPVMRAVASLLLLVVPLLGMRAIAGERQNASLPLLLVSGIGDTRIVLGKFFALVVFLCVLILLALAMPLSLESGTSLDIGRLIAAAFGMILFAGALTAIALAASASVQAPVLAAVLAIVINLLLWMADAGARYEGVSSSFINYLALPTHLEPFLHGMVASVDVAYFILLIVVALVLAQRGVSAARVNPTSRTRISTLVSMALLFAAALLVAFLSTRFVIQHDASYAQRASLDERTVTLLRRLDAPVTMTSYAPRDNQLRSAIADFIARYGRVKSDISLSFVDPDADPAATREAGIQVNGEVIIGYKGRREQLKVLTERELDNALQRLARERERLVAFLAGDGERKPDGEANADLGHFGALLKASGVRAIALTLTAGVHIPENVDAVVVAGPRAAIEPAVAGELVDYVERGGNILWLAEPGESAGLESLAKALSVRVLSGIVVDGTSAAFGIGDPSFVAITKYPANAVTRDFNLTTLFPQAAAIAKVLDAQWNAVSLLQTSEKSWTETGAIPKEGDTTTISFDAAKGEIAGPLDLGFTLTRLAPTPAKREQRAAVIGDGDFLSNAFLGNGGNRELGQRVFDWLLQDDELIDIADKGAPDRRIDLSQVQLGAIALGFLIVLPLLLLLTGAAVRRRRHRA